MAIFLHGKLARERVHEYVICTEMVMLSSGGISDLGE